MREIKFRAWQPSLKKMFYDCRVSSGDWIDQSTHFCGEHDTLMQYTGLKDKNSTEIYEGDILSIYHKHPNWHGDKSTWYVKTEETSWGYSFSWEHISGYDCSTHVMEDSPCNYEVIGNIYENPELVEVKNERANRS